jgi:hypothetical protein
MNSESEIVILNGVVIPASEMDKAIAERRALGEIKTVHMNDNTITLTEFDAIVFVSTVRKNIPPRPGGPAKAFRDVIGAYPDATLTDFEAALKRIMAKITPYAHFSSESML